MQIKAEAAIMNETMQLIIKMSNERQSLWYKASHGGLSAIEGNRVRELTDRLYTSWDQYRREYAAQYSHRNPAYIQVDHAA
jgi:hypothetical protein